MTDITVRSDTKQEEDGRGRVASRMEASLRYACLREKPLPRVVVSARVDR